MASALLAIMILGETAWPTRVAGPHAVRFFIREPTGACVLGGAVIGVLVGLSLAKLGAGIL